jgi:hypothetical protein
VVCFASVGDVGNVNYLEQNIVRLCMFLLSDLGCKIKIQFLCLLSLCSGNIEKKCADLLVLPVSLSVFYLDVTCTFLFTLLVLPYMYILLHEKDCSFADI